MENNQAYQKISLSVGRGSGCQKIRGKSDTLTPWCPSHWSAGILICLAIWSFVICPAGADVPRFINLQGRVTNASDAVIGGAILTFNIGGVAIPATGNTTNASGIFNAILDIGSPPRVDLGLPANANVEIFIGTDRIGSQPLNSVPYALRAAVAEELGGNALARLHGETAARTAADAVLTAVNTAQNTALHGEITARTAADEALTAANTAQDVAAEDRFVNVTGDTMTGTLEIRSGGRLRIREGGNLTIGNSPPATGANGLGIEGEISSKSKIRIGDYPPDPGAEGLGIEGEIRSKSKIRIGDRPPDPGTDGLGVSGMIKTNSKVYVGDDAPDPGEDGLGVEGKVKIGINAPEPSQYGLGVEGTIVTKNSVKIGEDAPNPVIRGLAVQGGVKIGDDPPTPTYAEGLMAEGSIKTKGKILVGNSAPEPNDEGVGVEGQLHVGGAAFIGNQDSGFKVKMFSYTRPEGSESVESAVAGSSALNNVIEHNSNAFYWLTNKKIYAINVVYSNFGSHSEHGAPHTRWFQRSDKVYAYYNKTGGGIRIVNNEDFAIDAQMTVIYQD